MIFFYFSSRKLDILILEKNLESIILEKDFMYYSNKNYKVNRNILIKYG